jgi:RNA polymerase sigma-70 factor (ECF subfamily)
VYPATEPTDDALVAAATAGDETAFEALFNRHRRQVARIAGRFFAQREQIEEIIQDAFTKLYFALHTYHGTHEASFKAWLAQITVNTCYDQLRRVRRRSEQTLGEFTETETQDFSSQLRVAASDVETALDFARPRAETADPVERRRSAGPHAAGCRRIFGRGDR